MIINKKTFSKFHNLLSKKEKYSRATELEISIYINIITSSIYLVLEELIKIKISLSKI